MKHYYLVQAGEEIHEREELMDKHPFKKGDKVVTNFIVEEKEIIRTVIDCRPVGSGCQSGYLMSVNGGEPCPHCGKRGKGIREIDSAWFKKAKRGE